MLNNIKQEQPNNLLETSDITPCKACFRFILPKQLISATNDEYKITVKMLKELKSLIASTISTTKKLKIIPTVLNVEEPGTRFKSVSSTERDNIYERHDLFSFRDDRVAIQYFEVNLSNFSFTEAAAIFNPERLNSNYKETSKSYYLLFDSLTYYQDFVGCLDNVSIFNYLVTTLNFAIEGKPANELKHNFLNSTVKEPTTTDLVFYMRNSKIKCGRKDNNETRETVTLFNRQTFIFTKNKTQHFFNMLNSRIFEPFVYLTKEEINNNKIILSETAPPLTTDEIQNIPQEILNTGMIVKEIENKMREVLELLNNSTINNLADIEDNAKIEVIAIIHQYQNHYLIFTSDKEFYKANTLINNIIDDLLIKGAISFNFKNIVYYNNKIIFSFQPIRLENPYNYSHYTHITKSKFNGEIPQENMTQTTQFTTFSKYYLEPINHTINLPTLRSLNTLTENCYLVVGVEPLLTKKEELIHVLRLDGFNLDFKANFFINEIFKTHGIPTHKFLIFKGNKRPTQENKNVTQWFLSENERDQTLAEQERQKQEEILLKEEQDKIKKQLRQEQEQKRDEKRKLMKCNLIRLDDVEEDTEIIIDKVFRRPTGKLDKFIIESDGVNYLSNQFAENEIKKYELEILTGHILKVLKFKTTKTKNKSRNVQIIKNKA